MVVFKRGSFYFLGKKVAVTDSGVRKKRATVETSLRLRDLPLTRKRFVGN